MPVKGQRKIYKPWVKLHVRTLYNEDIAELPDSSKWKFIECLLLAGEERNRAIESGEDQDDGYLPPLKRMAFILRTTQPVLQDDLSRLAMAGLVELCQHPDGNDRWFVTHFAKWQERTGEAERQRFSRSARKNEEKKEEDRYRIIDEQNSSQLSHKVVTESRAPKPQPSMITQSHPAVRAVYQVTTFWPAEAAQPVIIEKLGDAPDIKALERAYQLWVSRDYNPRNFDGIGEWYKELVRNPNWMPPAQHKNGNAPNGTNETESLWQKALSAINAGRVDDERLKAAIKAIGGSSAIKSANEFTTRQLKERLASEYRTIATA